MKQTVPMLARAASVEPATLNADKRTVDLVWSTGAQVRRVDWWSGQQYLEELTMAPQAIRLDRLNAGANLLESHSQYSLQSVLGVVEKAWLDGGRGMATVRFSERTAVDAVRSDVKNGIIRSVSVGYLVHKYERRRAAKDGELDVLRAIDWEPIEISLVAVPADPGATVRAAAHCAECEIEEIRDAGAASTPTVLPLSHLLRVNRNRTRRLTV